MSCFAGHHLCVCDPPTEANGKAPVRAARGMDHRRQGLPFPNGRRYRVCGPKFREPYHMDDVRTAFRPLAVLMATCRGAAWLGPQLDSIAVQTRPPDVILVSDDGSDDGTCALLDDFAGRHPELDLSRLAGPCTGAADNFLSLVRRTPSDIDRVAFADQDDVWLPGKLERAMVALDACDRTVPVMYCARIFICDSKLRRRVPSRLPPRALGFRNALIQNIATGSTIVLNRAALQLAREAAALTGPVVMHDWWLYQIVTGAGGRVLFDPEPQVLYRQHATNLMGANRGAKARITRAGQLLSGVYSGWNRCNLAALDAARHLLTPDNAAIRDAFARTRTGHLRDRVGGLHRQGLYRQGRLGQMALYLAAALDRI